MAGGTGAKLPRKQNVVRYVGGLHYDREKDQVAGSAFDRTTKDNDGLSFTQRRILDADSEADKDSIRKVFASRMSLGRTACFAELNVGKALDALDEFEQDFSFVENPIPAEGDKLANPAHVLLIGLPFKGEVVGTLRSELAGDRLCRAIIGKFPAHKTAD
ncbi:hypothetical protein [Sphingorhabdus sp.]|uniref:hypothetical protein n=1 Tax=Sphingorhabdus sp. TaxID=1902408 RepID=UPI0032B81BB9